MPPAERLARQIAFLIECDRLKDIVRQTLNAHSGRPENDAEHSCYAFARLGANAPTFSITSVIDNWSPNIFRRVAGVITVDRYVDSVNAPARLVLGGKSIDAVRDVWAGFLVRTVSLAG